MNKRIIALITSLLILCSMLVIPASADGLSPITYDGERIEIEATVDAPEGSYVTVIVGKPGTTLAQVQAATAAQLLPLVEYIGVFPVSATTPNLNATIELRENLATGTCEVYIATMTTAFSKLGEFENLSRLEIAGMVTAFNETAVESYGTLFTDNNKMYLRAFNADVTSYEALDTQVTNFYSFLVGKRPFAAAAAGETDVGVLVKAFNEGIAFASLSEATAEEITEVSSLLNSYNTKYWNLALGEDTPYGNLSQTQKDRICAAIGNGTYYDAASLESDFNTQLAISVFLECATEMDLLSAMTTYGSVYQLDATLMQDSRIDEYYTTMIHNEMIANKHLVSDVSTLQSVYAQAISTVLAGIPVVDDDDDDRYYGSTGGGGGGGGGIIIKDDKKPSTDLVPVPEKSFFRDVAETHWAYENIQKLYDKKIVSGKGDGQFAPSDNVTREEYAKMMVLALDSSITDSTVSYSDVKAGSWYQPYIATAVRDGLINGLGDGTVGIGKALSREDAAVMIERALTREGITLKDAGTAFGDNDQIADYAKSAVGKLVQTGILTGYGDNTFMPKQTISRAEVCTVIVRMINLLEGEGK
ncbi:MAG: S-layer homology domain-containing protein [Ruminococcaceae bacterium]|nr:S-layer homology domain-containing protein [Oscillospiraceae bacterium]